MHFARKLFAASMIGVAGTVGAALALSAPAAAEPAPAPAPAPAAPSIPGLPFLNLANAPMMLQGLASTLSGATGAASPAAVPAATPTASATLNLPPGQGPLGLAPAAPAAAGAPAANAAAPAAQGLVPSAEVNLPQVPGTPLPQQVDLPGDLSSLMPAGTPLSNLLPKPAAPAAPAAPGAPAPTTGAQSLQSLAPLVFPASALP